MKTREKSPQSKGVAEVKTRLQIRVVHQDHHGKIRDVTHDDVLDLGLNDLQTQSSNASDGLSRVRELLQLLALAAENREHVETTLVQRVLQEVDMSLDVGSDLDSYVRYTEQLFAGAMALPRITGIHPRVFADDHVSPGSTDQALALVS